MADISNSIGGDNFGDIVQAGRDANVTKVTGAVDAMEALIAVRRLRRALGGAGLRAEDHAEVSRAIDEIESELRTPEPNRQRVAGRLERVTGLLKAGGALVTAGAAIANPIGTIVNWIGPLGAAVANALRSG